MPNLPSRLSNLVPAGLRRRLAALWRRPSAPTAVRYVLLDDATPLSPRVDVRLPADAATPEEVTAWLARQTLTELVADTAAGDADPTALWFYAPGTLPNLAAAHLETCLLVAAAEAVDAVTLLPPGMTTDSRDASAVCHQPLRAWTLYRHDAYAYDPAGDRVAPDRVRPRRATQLVKLLHDTAGGRPAGTTPYLTTPAAGGELRVGLRDAGRLTRRRLETRRIPLLITTSFLARGGAEHTLFETLRALSDRYDPTIATLAPHHPELGDRRPDFATLTPRIYPLGDCVHPDAMLGILRALLAATGAKALYNANSTTLFYPFAAQLKRERPDLRIIDHLYDHRVGYVERYDDPALRLSIDACVAENRQIHERLCRQGWPAQRAPVIWPCGRPPDSLPLPSEVPALRRRLRQSLGIAEQDVVFFTAARMHEQKRLLDLVAVARRVRDTPAVFLLAGGGPLEQVIDQAIATSEGARIRRLPFRDDVPALIASSDVGCLVSAFEGLPVFLLECLQLGRPFLGTRVGEMGDLLDETGAGLVVDQPGDLTALEAAVRTLCDPRWRDPLAARAQAAGGRFGIATCAAQYAAVFAGSAVS